jgi:hypothetical protein
VVAPSGAELDTSRPIAASDRAAERLIRDRVAEAVSRLLGDGRLLTPNGEDEERVRTLIEEEVAAYERRAVTTNAPLLLDPERLKQRLFDTVFGLGILQPMMDDPRVEEIIVNGPLRVFAIRDGRKEQVGVYFESDDELRQLVKRVISSAGRRLDDAAPMVDVRLRDGSRLNAVIPPASTRSARSTRLKASVPPVPSWASRPRASTRRPGYATVPWSWSTPAAAWSATAPPG